MNKVPYPQAVGEEYQVVNMGREYHDCGKEYNVKKGEGDGYFGEENQDLKKMGAGKNIKL